MVATFKYDSITNNFKDKLTEGGFIFECCEKETPDDPKNCLDCCYDDWRDEQKNVTQSYLKQKELADQISNELAFKKDRRDRYKKWTDELDKVDELARNVCAQLEIIVSQSSKIWYSSCKAVDAIQILFCMIRDFFMQVDKIKSYYDDIQKCTIGKSMDMGTSLMTSFINYGKNLEAVLKTRDDIIKIIIDSIRLSNLIQNSISSKACITNNEDCSDGFEPCKPENNLCDEAPYGFKRIICDWYSVFNCKEKCNENASSNDTSETPPENGQMGRASGSNSGNENPCKNEICELTPMFSFPICNNDYKDEVKQKYDNDVLCVNKLLDDLMKANKEKESLLACKNSLDKAILEVDPKERCKN